MATGSEPRALTRGWFHGWCQCGSDQLQLTDVWPQGPYLTCADCGQVGSHVSATYYALTDTQNGRHYINYRCMEWPYYPMHGASVAIPYRAVWSRIRLHERHGGIPDIGECCDDCGANIVRGAAHRAGCAIVQDR